MKKALFLICFLFLGHAAFTQQYWQHRIDSLRHELLIAKQDTSRVSILLNMSSAFDRVNLDSTLSYAQRAKSLAEESQYRLGRAHARLGKSWRLLGDYPKALSISFMGLRISEAEGDYNAIGLNELRIATVYSQFLDEENGIIHVNRSINAYEIAKNDMWVTISRMVKGRLFRRLNQLDSAAHYLQLAHDKIDYFRFDGMGAFLKMEMGHLEFLLGNHEKALVYLRESMRLSDKLEEHFYKAFASNTAALVFKDLNRVDSSIYNAQKGLSIAEEKGYKFLSLESLRLLAENFEPIDLVKGNYYLKKWVDANNELYGSQKVKDLQKTLAEEQERLRIVEEERVADRNKLRQNIFLAGLAILIFIAIVLYRNNKRKQKDNEQLQKQKEEIGHTLSQLKSTQSQLIQSEKMASLGELTAGIAHEIQNPLNFVNNFSEVSEEMLAEMKEALGRVRPPHHSGPDDELIKELLDDMEQNLSKIHHHGNRASSIVKGMLEHSQTSSGEKTATDLNALADEYLRLAYHGLRAKDKTFNADFKTDFDKNLPKVEVVSQDLSRVLLNLINNGFQAVQEQAKKGMEGYKPELIISTKKLEDKVEISIKDNGPGIPDEIKDKIFQPFFTTKPTGQGTGLGLSLAYDIVKAHGGTLELSNDENFATVFQIKLPI